MSPNVSDAFFLFAIVEVTLCRLWATGVSPLLELFYFLISHSMHFPSSLLTQGGATLLSPNACDAFFFICHY